MSGDQDQGGGVALLAGGAVVGQHHLFYHAARSIGDCAAECVRRGERLLDAERLPANPAKVAGSMPVYLAVYDGERGRERRLMAGAPRMLRYQEVDQFVWHVKAMAARS